MVEDLLHLLSCHHLLDKSVDLAQILLLFHEIFPAPFPIEADKQEHERHTAQHDKRQTEA